MTKYRGNRAGLRNRVKRDLLSSRNCILSTPADGHCLLHAVLLSWTEQFNLSSVTHRPSLEELRRKIYTEVYSKRSFYAAVNGLSIPVVIEQLHKYLDNKIYDLELVDYMPKIICEVLNINI